MQRQGFDESFRVKKIFSMFGIGCPTSRKVPKMIMNAVKKIKKK
jgi:hypothetical protein